MRFEDVKEGGRYVYRGARKELHGEEVTALHVNPLISTSWIIRFDDGIKRSANPVWFDPVIEDLSVEPAFEPDRFDMMVFLESL